jgi:hypothetical protein
MFAFTSGAPTGLALMAIIGVSNLMNFNRDRGCPMLSNATPLG